MERQSGHRVCQVDHGLHLPLAADAFSHRPAANAIRQPEAAARRQRRSYRRHLRCQWHCVFWRSEVRGPRSRFLRPRRRRAVEHRRSRRRSQLQLLRQHHDQKWKLLPLHELRQHQRLQLNLPVIQNDGLSFYLTIRFSFLILISGRRYVRFGRFFDNYSCLRVCFQCLSLRYV